MTELRDAGHEEKTKALDVGFNRKKEFTYNPTNAFEERRIVQTLRERSVVFVDEDDQVPRRLVPQPV